MSASEQAGLFPIGQRFLILDRGRNEAYDWRAFSCTQRSRSERFRSNCSRAKPSANTRSSSLLEKLRITPSLRSTPISDVYASSAALNRSSKGAERCEARAAALPCR